MRLVPVVLDVRLCRFRCVVGCMMRVSLRGVRMVSGLVVVTRLVMLGSLTMVVSGVLVVLGGLKVMLRCLFGHGCLPIVADCTTHKTVGSLCYGNVRGGLSFMPPWKSRPGIAACVFHSLEDSVFDLIGGEKYALTLHIGVRKCQILALSVRMAARRYRRKFESAWA
jgi:hypothetical protein